MRCVVGAFSCNLSTLYGFFLLLYYPLTFPNFTSMSFLQTTLKCIFTKLDKYFMIFYSEGFPCFALTSGTLLDISLTIFIPSSGLPLNSALFFSSSAISFSRAKNLANFFVLAFLDIGSEVRNCHPIITYIFSERVTGC